MKLSSILLTTRDVPALVNAGDAVAAANRSAIFELESPTWMPSEHASTGS